MLIIPFDPFTPFIKGVEYANDQNQQDIKFEQERVMRTADLAAKQASNDLNASLLPFKLRAAENADALGTAAQPGGLARVTARSTAAVDNAADIYDAEAGKLRTAGIKAALDVDEAVLKFDAWNDGGRDLSAFKKSNDITIGSVVETLRKAKADQQTENLPALVPLMKQQVDIATKVVANAVKTKDVNAIRDAMLIQDRAVNVQTEVEAEVLKRAADVAKRSADAQNAIGENAVRVLPEVVANRASVIASTAEMSAREAEAANRTSLENRTIEGQRRLLVGAVTGGQLGTFKAAADSVTNVPPDPTARATYLDARATEMDEAYQTLQKQVGAQLPEGMIVGGGNGIFFQGIGQDPIPLRQLLNVYKPVFEFVVPTAQAPRGKSPAQQTADVKLTEAKAAEAIAGAAQKNAKARSVGGTTAPTAPTATTRLDAIKKPPL